MEEPTTTMIASRGFTIHTGTSRVRHSHDTFVVKKGENQVPNSLVDHWAMKAHGVVIKQES